MKMKVLISLVAVLMTGSVNAAYIDDAVVCNSIDSLQELAIAYQSNDLQKVQTLAISGKCDTVHERREVKGVMNPGQGYVVFTFEDNGETGVTLTKFLKDYE
ncbi:hypothetical protein [Kosakonia radicincitans]|uniref:hypothetical protein n=1 Tax=Kosakonia radicincitans TaxID=283686 RepID=UPI0023689BB8|nr:hypothetical protein [Kosakonia radicincitans]MDD7993779.1 hypothetical protein [Kosakonia radicincitans]